jgi:lipoate-protein ligase B
MEEPQALPRSLRARWLGRLAYREAWAIQRALAAARAEGRLTEDQLLLLEHDPVLTLGRRATEAHVVALPEMLAERGIEVVRVERGGEVTYHGPGQLVAYPIVALASPGVAGAQGAGGQVAGAQGAAAQAAWGQAGPRSLGVRPFVEALEDAMAETCAALGVAAGRRPGHTGCWVDAGGPLPRKIGALGIRVARGVSFHGIALNVTTNLADFDLINPCGMPGIRSTSVAAELSRAGRTAPTSPSTESVAQAAALFAPALCRRLGFAPAGDLPPFADAARERRELEDLAAWLGPAPATPEGATPEPATAGAR